MKTIFIITVLTLLPSQWVHAEATNAEEYEIKAAYLFSLGTFVRWQKEISTQNFEICVFGEDPFGRNLDYIAQKGKQIQDHNVSLRRLSSLNDVYSCHILFLSSSLQPQFAAIFAAIKKKPILTVGDTKHFVIEGGMIQFYRREDKIRLLLDPQTIEDSGLKASARLMEIAQIVKK